MAITMFWAEYSNDVMLMTTIIINFVACTRILYSSLSFPRSDMMSEWRVRIQAEILRDTTEKKNKKKKKPPVSRYFFFFERNIIKYLKTLATKL